MEIKRREILFSLAILAMMIGFGMWISSPILSKAVDKYIEKASSVVVGDDSKFDYIRRTEVGNFIANGTLSVIDTIRVSELPKTYSYVKKQKERYTMHTQTYVTTDGKGHSQVHTRTYWSWDVVHTDVYKSKRGRFLGQPFEMEEVFSYFLHTARDTVIKESSNVRYVYYTAPPSFDGIMVGKAEGKKYIEPKFISGTTSDKYIEKAAKGLNTGNIVFWIFWMILTFGLIFGFYYLENRWLD